MKHILFAGLLCGALLAPALSHAQGFPVWQWPSQPAQSAQSAQSSRPSQPAQSGQPDQSRPAQQNQAGRPNQSGQAPRPGAVMPGLPGLPGMQMTPGRPGAFGPGPRDPRQNNERIRDISERIKADRVNFFTSHIQLTPVEAQRFWPIYNEFDAKKDELYKQRMEIAMRYMSNSNTLTDRELESMLTAYWNINQKESRLAADYHKKFLNVLPAAKVMRLYMTEEQFKNSYLQRMRGGAGL